MIYSNKILRFGYFATNVFCLLLILSIPNSVLNRAFYLSPFVCLFVVTYLAATISYVLVQGSDPGYLNELCLQV